jgi:cellulose synthase/poly-beta-1,6-N-acetylglucosamine synthase-like glycosyltransferase
MKNEISKPKATLIVAIYNNIPFLKAVLDSLDSQTEKDFEIIITEDGEDSKVKEFIDKYPFGQPWKHLTQKDEGWRKNKALNNAIREATSDWFIFIDGDCVLHPRFVEMHVRYANDNHILAGKRVKLDRKSSAFLLSKSSNVLLLQNILLKKLFFGKGDIKFIEDGIFISPDGLFGFIPKIRTLNHLKGCNMSFSRKAIYHINGFDEDYRKPAVGEDYDLTWRFNSAGFIHKSVRNLAVQYHLHHTESWVNQDENLDICRRNQLENKFICKNGLVKK